jgi:hypothetical protein
MSALMRNSLLLIIYKEPQFFGAKIAFFHNPQNKPPNFGGN